MTSITITLLQKSFVHGGGSARSITISQLLLKFCPLSLLLIESAVEEPKEAADRADQEDTKRDSNGKSDSSCCGGVGGSGWSQSLR